MPVEREALFGHSRYRMPMPCTVDIEFHLDTGARRHLWMTASPLDERSCRSFWFIARDDDLDGDDAVRRSHLAFQQIVLDEDEPVVCNQDPPEMVLDPDFELSVRTDRVLDRVPPLAARARRPPRPTAPTPCAAPSPNRR